MIRDFNNSHGALGVLQCRVCGVEYDAAALPELCPICADERQYLAPDGRQHWVHPEEFGADPQGGAIDLVELEPGLWGINVSRGVGIGQQAKVVVTDSGNVMVEVPAAITPEAVTAVDELGRMEAIVPSHPHMFGLQSLWSAALGEVPVYVSSLDAEWLGARPENLHLWEGEIEVIPGVSASQPGGHFPGSAVVHWAGADGLGVLLCGDTIGVNADGRSTTFMRSYPNSIPLSAQVAKRIAAHVERFEFDRLYGNFPSSILTRAKSRVMASAERHSAWVSGEFDHLT